jgi:hypothetical protein
MYQQNLAARERVLDAGHFGTLATRDNIDFTHPAAGRRGREDQAVVF